MVHVGAFETGLENVDYTERCKILTGREMGVPSFLRNLERICVCMFKYCRKFDLSYFSVWFYQGNKSGNWVIFDHFINGSMVHHYVNHIRRACYCTSMDYFGANTIAMCFPPISINTHVKRSSHTARNCLLSQRKLTEGTNNSPPCVMVKWCEVQIPSYNFLGFLNLLFDWQHCHEGVISIFFVSCLLQSQYIPYGIDYNP